MSPYFRLSMSKYYEEIFKLTRIIMTNFINFYLKQFSVSFNFFTGQYFCFFYYFHPSTIHSSPSPTSTHTPLTPLTVPVTSLTFSPSCIVYFSILCREPHLKYFLITNILQNSSMKTSTRLCFSKKSPKTFLIVVNFHMVTCYPCQNTWLLF